MLYKHSPFGLMFILYQASSQHNRCYECYAQIFNADCLVLLTQLIESRDSLSNCLLPESTRVPSVLHPSTEEVSPTFNFNCFLDTLTLVKQLVLWCSTWLSTFCLGSFFVSPSNSCSSWSELVSEQLKLKVVSCLHGVPSPSSVVWNLCRGQKNLKQEGSSMYISLGLLLLTMYWESRLVVCNYYD